MVVIENLSTRPMRELGESHVSIYSTLDHLQYLSSRIVPFGELAPLCGPLNDVRHIQRVNTRAHSFLLTISTPLKTTSVRVALH